MSDDINMRCTTALRALEAAGVIRSAWLPGMLDVCGWRVIRIDGRLDGQKYLITCETERDSPDGDRQYPGEGMWNWSLTYDHDLSDPVTAASLIVLVREAWGDPCAHTLPCLPIGSWLGRGDNGDAIGWGVSVRGAGETLFGSWPTETEALVAALEAKVREVCGG